MNQKVGSHQIYNLLTYSSWASQPPGLGEINFCCSWAPWSVVTCYSAEIDWDTMESIPNPFRVQPPASPLCTLHPLLTLRSLDNPFLIVQVSWSPLTNYEPRLSLLTYVTSYPVPTGPDAPAEATKFSIPLPMSSTQSKPGVSSSPPHFC